MLCPRYFIDIYRYIDNLVNTMFSFVAYFAYMGVQDRKMFISRSYVFRNFKCDFICTTGFEGVGLVNWNNFSIQQSSYYK